MSYHHLRSLVGKLALIQTGFLVVALASIAFTLWVSWQLEGGAGAINEAGAHAHDELSHGAVAG